MSVSVILLDKLNELVRDRTFGSGFQGLDYKDPDMRVTVSVIAGRLSVKVLMVLDRELEQAQLLVRDTYDGLLRIEPFVKSDNRKYEYYVNLDLPQLQFVKLVFDR